MKEEKEHREREAKTRERDNERVIYAVSSSVVSLHYEKLHGQAKKESTGRVRKHNDLRRRQGE